MICKACTAFIFCVGLRYVLHKGGDEDYTRDAPADEEPGRHIGESKALSDVYELEPA